MLPIETYTASFSYDELQIENVRLIVRPLGTLGRPSVHPDPRYFFGKNFL